MHHNPVWLTFLIVIGLIVCWFAFQAFWKMYAYSQLDRGIPAKRVEWSVKELSDEAYVLEGRYEYQVGETPYTGSTDFSDDVYRNAWAAEQVIPIYSKEESQVWYSHKNPKYSSLQKKFPLKECITAGFLAGLFGYFLWLGFYVGRYRT